MHLFSTTYLQLFKIKIIHRNIENSHSLSAIELPLIRHDDEISIWRPRIQLILDVGLREEVQSVGLHIPSAPEAQ